MKIFLGIAIIFAIYEVGYSLGYKHCADIVKEIIDNIKDNENEM